MSLPTNLHVIVILFFSLFVASGTTAKRSIGPLELNQSKTITEQAIDAPKLSAIDLSLIHI